MTPQAKFQKIALIGRSRHKEIRQTLAAVYAYLTDKNYQVVFEEETAKIIDFEAESVNCQELNQQADLLVVVGGDGSLLKAAHIALQVDLPVVGINRGSLGFLTDIYPNDFHQLAEILNGEYWCEQRIMLDISVYENDQMLYQNIALNDVVLSTATVAHMIQFDVFVNRQLLCHLRADGIIVATPTGSTAYALSGGGPIISPGLNTLLMVPMFPHTLSNRPIVVDSQSEISIQLNGSRNGNSRITTDGQNDLSFKPGYKLLIKQSEKRLQLIHPKDYNYFETLRVKLHWQGNVTQPG